MDRFANVLLSALFAAVAVTGLCLPLFALMRWIFGGGE